VYREGESALRGVEHVVMATVGGRFVQFLLKTDRGVSASDLDEATGRKILKRGRHEGRRVVEVFVLHPGGEVDRYQERARRKLGSNAIISRTWLCETYSPGGDDEWGDDRYIPNPEEAIADTEPAPDAIVLVLIGAENDEAHIVEQLAALQSPSS
jgi:hypothetical protein